MKHPATSLCATCCEPIVARQVTPGCWRKFNPDGSPHVCNLTVPVDRVCTECGRTVRYSVALDSDHNVSDSIGGMQFDDGFVCDRCVERLGDAEGRQ